MTSPTRSPVTLHRAPLRWLVDVLAIVVSIAVVFEPARHFDFVNYDDLEFVVDNSPTGLTAENIVWAFQNPYTATGGPLTWISHMLDVQLFGAYVAHVRQPSLWRYAIVTFSFVLDLLSKPMIATLPLTLLLFDYWPLRRWSLEQPRHVSRLVLEKVPLLALSFASMLITLAAQREIGAVAGFESIPLPVRMANASVSYLTYVRKMLWPTELAVFYPYRDSIALTASLACGAAILVISVCALLLAKRAPFVTTGWFWYAIALAPVAGVVQVEGARWRTDSAMCP